MEEVVAEGIRSQPDKVYVICQPNVERKVNLDLTYNAAILVTLCELTIDSPALDLRLQPG